MALPGRKGPPAGGWAGCGPSRLPECACARACVGECVGCAPRGVARARAAAVALTSSRAGSDRARLKGAEGAVTWAVRGWWLPRPLPVQQCEEGARHTADWARRPASGAAERAHAHLMPPRTRAVALCHGAVLASVTRCAPP
eukprot:scaffold1883_cov396-Prasinococcus_capsulatus_cf.AAC.18